MRWKETAGTFVIRMEIGEEVIDFLTEFARAQQIPGGSIQGLGAVKDVVLGLFDPHTKTYVKRTFEDDMELGNLTGNFAWFEGEPVLHCHGTVGGADLRAFTGHLFSATVAVTVECIITPFPDHINRAHDEETGLNLLDL